MIGEIDLTYLKLMFLDECDNKDESCDKCSETSSCDKDIFCSSPWVVLNCPKVCDKSCSLDRKRYAMEK